MSFRQPLFFSVMILAGVIPAMGQARNGANIPSARNQYSIAGMVRDDVSQQPLENVRIDLKQQGGATLSTAYTRGEGDFEFPNLGNGEYVLEVSLKGYETFHQTVNVLDGPVRGYSVYMERERGAVITGTNPSVSAHELRVPQKARDEYEKGMALLYGKGDPRGALPRFERAIKDYPDYYEAVAQEGSAYFTAGDVASGEAALKKSVEMSSERYADAFFIYAAALNNLGRFQEAEAHARKGVALDDASWEGHFELARALSGLKQPDEAEQHAVIARNLKPDRPEVYLVLANIHIQKQNYPSLLEDLTVYLKLSPTGPQADQARATRDKLQAALRNVQTRPGPPPPESEPGNSPEPAAPESQQ
jgi:tetratricopeptide (TPR) repeat protein